MCHMICKSLFLRVGLMSDSHLGCRPRVCRSGQINLHCHRGHRVLFLSCGALRSPLEPTTQWQPQLQ